MKNKIEKLKNKKIIFQHIRGNNDTNGNPNRIFAIYDLKLNYLGWIDEGYVGMAFSHGRKCKELISIYVSGTKASKIGQEFFNEGLK